MIVKYKLFVHPPNQSQSKSRLVHALDSLACNLCRWSMVLQCANRSWKEVVKHNLGMRLVSFFSMLYLLSRANETRHKLCKRDLTKASTDRYQYPICTTPGIGWVSLAKLHCLYVSVNCSASINGFLDLGCCSASLYTAFILFSQLLNHSAWFLNRTTLFCIIESQPLQKLLIGL